MTKEKKLVSCYDCNRGKKCPYPAIKNAVISSNIIINLKRYCFKEKKVVHGS